jgi:hypothetical protein
MPDATPIVLDWEDIFYQAVVTPANFAADDSKPTLLRFEVYRLESYGDDGPDYLLKDYRGSGSVTRDRALAGRFAEGNIKWDGCSNVRFKLDMPEQYEHFCSREQARAWATIVDRLFDKMAELRAPDNSDLD